MTDPNRLTQDTDSIRITNNAFPADLLDLSDFDPATDGRYLNYLTTGDSSSLFPRTPTSPLDAQTILAETGIYRTASAPPTFGQPSAVSVPVVDTGIGVGIPPARPRAATATRTSATPARVVVTPPSTGRSPPTPGTPSSGFSSPPSTPRRGVGAARRGARRGAATPRAPRVTARSGRVPRRQPPPIGINTATATNVNRRGGRAGTRLNQNQLQQILQREQNAQRQNGTNRRIAGITHTDTITTVYKDGGTPRVQRISSATRNP